jgi:hypothetical protein
VERREGENVEHIGEYLEIVRPRRLAFTLSVEKYSLDFERVTVLFDPHGTVRTQLDPQNKAEIGEAGESRLDQNA